MRASCWTRRHLLGLEELSADEVNAVLDTAEHFKRATGDCRRKLNVLAGKTCANLFFENSTRTRTSFSLAARRLGADTIDFSSTGSSVSKGETFIDTAKTIEAMGIDAVVVRHRTPGTPHLLAQTLSCTVINGGDGPHEHPTQGLLDILTIRQHRGSLAGLTVGLVGDIAHSRTARSNIWGLKKLGAHVIVCGPSTLVSKRWEELGIEVSYNLDDVIPPGGRAEPVADSIRAALDAAVSLRAGICVALCDDPGADGSREERHPDHGPRPDQSWRRNHARRGRRPALGHSGASQQRPRHPHGGAVALLRTEFSGRRSLVRYRRA